MDGPGAERRRHQRLRRALHVLDHGGRRRGRLRQRPVGRVGRREPQRHDCLGVDYRPKRQHGLPGAGASEEHTRPRRLVFAAVGKDGGGAVLERRPERTDGGQQHEFERHVHGFQHRDLLGFNDELHGIGGERPDACEADADGGGHRQGDGGSAQGVIGQFHGGDERLGERGDRTQCGRKRARGAGDGREFDYQGLHGHRYEGDDHPVLEREPERVDSGQQHEFERRVLEFQHRDLLDFNDELLRDSGERPDACEADADGGGHRQGDGGRAQGVLGRLHGGDERLGECGDRARRGVEHARGAGDGRGHDDQRLHGHRHEDGGTVLKRKPGCADGGQQHEFGRHVHECQHRDLLGFDDELHGIGGERPDACEADADGGGHRQGDGGRAQGVLGQFRVGDERLGECGDRARRGVEHARGAGDRREHNDQRLHGHRHERVGAAHEREPGRADGEQQHEFDRHVHECQHRDLLGFDDELHGIGGERPDACEADADGVRHRQGDGGGAQGVLGQFRIGDERLGECGDRARRGAEHARGAGDSRGRDDHQGLYSHRHAAYTAVDARRADGPVGHAGRCAAEGVVDGAERFLHWLSTGHYLGHRERCRQWCGSVRFQCCCGMDNGGDTRENFDLVHDRQ